MFVNVAVGVSGDERALDALALAKTLASSGGVPSLVYVEVDPERPAGADDGARVVRGDGLPEPLLTLPDETNVAGCPLVVVGASSARAGLHDYAVRAGADLLVVGASRRDRLRRAAGGDDTSAVLKAPPCAVAVAPAGYAGRPREVRTIGVGYDGSIASEQALAAARTLAVEHRAKLSAFEAVPPRFFPYEIHQRVDAARRRVAGLGGVEGRRVRPRGR